MDKYFLFAVFNQSFNSIRLCLSEIFGHNFSPRPAYHHRRGIRDYENKSEEELIKIRSKPKPKISISKEIIKEIKKKIKKIINFRKSFCKIKSHRNLEVRKTEKSLIELEKSLHDYGSPKVPSVWCKIFLISCKGFLVW